MSNTYNTDDEDDPVAAALNAAAAQEEAARFSQRASYKGFVLNSPCLQI
jgi:hypothetical protein